MATRLHRMADEALVDTDGAELSVDACLFRRASDGLAFVVILLMLAAIFAFIVTAWRLDRMAAWVFFPYAPWVAFASVLNGSIWAMN